MEIIMENKDTSGFYWYAEGSKLAFAPNFVLNADYHLKREEYTANTYPIDGWSWYNSEEEARVALGCPSDIEEAFNALSDEEKRRLLGLE
jgi:hypothetical protein